MRDLKFKIASWMVIGVGVLGFIPGFLPFRTGKVILVEWAIFFAIALWFIKNIWVRLFLIWCILRVVIGLNQFSQITLHTIVFAMVLFQILSDKLNKDRINTILNVICGLALLQSAMVILQSFGVWFITFPLGVPTGTACHILFPKTLHSIYIFGNQIRAVPVGFLDNPNIASAFLAMCLPAFFRKERIRLVFFIILALGLIHSFGGILTCVIISAIFLGVKFGRKGLLFLIPVILIFTMYFTTSESVPNILDLSNRREVWNFHITKLIPKRPIIGWGLGQEPFLASIIRKEIKPDDQKWAHSHNEAISLTTELGLIGLFIVCGYFITTFRKLKKHNLIITCGLVACILASLSIFSMHSAIGLLLIIYMAMAERSKLDGLTG